MLSEHKRLIRVFECVALIGGVGMVALGLGVRLGRFEPTQVEPLLVPAFLLMFMPFGLTVMLASEFARAIRRPRRSAFGEEGLSISEVRQLVSWSPVPLRYAFAAAIGLLAYVVIAIGPVEWSSNQPFTSREAQGFPLFMSAFLLVSVPVLASASRMPGSFEDNVSSGERRQHPNG
jgi:uncharacterized membrane protein YadS